MRVRGWNACRKEGEVKSRIVKKGNGEEKDVE